MSTVTLQEVLAERERRALRRNELIFEHRLPVITFTMNLAGEKKRGALSDFAFGKGAAMLKKRLGEPLFYELFDSAAGLCAFFVYNEHAAVLKKICMELEDSEIGRLFDFDVTDEHGTALSRPVLRRCLLCGRPAAECARSREHPIEQVEAKTEELLLRFAAAELSAGARSALITELYLTPKPGLVDRSNCGAHSDMDCSLFEKSAAAIAPYFEHAVLLGANGAKLALLEAEGISAEKAMFAATGGVNTHKGAVFLFMLLLYGCGSFFLRGENPFDAAAALAAEKSAAKNTHGAKIREKYCISGVFGEAATGFSTAIFAAELLAGGCTPLRVLFEIMARTADSNVLFRGGKAALAFVKESAAAALSLPEEELLAEAERLDREFILRGISPGGCADILALAIFIARELPQSLWQNNVICVSASQNDLCEIKEMFALLIKKMASENLFIWDEVYPACAFAQDIAKNRLYTLRQSGTLRAVFALGTDSDSGAFSGWKKPAAKALFLMRLGVNPSCSGSGFGTAAVKKAAALAKAAGAEYLRLFVAADNLPAIRFYEKCGFCRSDGIFRKEIAPNELLSEYGYELLLQ